MVPCSLSRLWNHLHRVFKHEAGGRDVENTWQDVRAALRVAPSRPKQFEVWAGCPHFQRLDVTKPRYRGGCTVVDSVFKHRPRDRGAGGIAPWKQKWRLIFLRKKSLDLIRVCQVALNFVFVIFNIISIEQMLICANSIPVAFGKSWCHSINDKAMNF